MGACCHAIRTPAKANITAFGIGKRVSAGVLRRQACMAREALGSCDVTCRGSPGVKWASAATVCDPMLAAAPARYLYVK